MWSRKRTPRTYCCWLFPWLPLNDELTWWFWYKYLWRISCRLCLPFNTADHYRDWWGGAGDDLIPELTRILRTYHLVVSPFGRYVWTCVDFLLPCCRRYDSLLSFVVKYPGNTTPQFSKIECKWTLFYFINSWSGCNNFIAHNIPFLLTSAVIHIDTLQTVKLMILCF